MEEEEEWRGTERQAVRPRAYRPSYSRLWHLYLQQLNRRPTLVKGLTSAFIATAGNVFAQKFVQPHKLSNSDAFKFLVIGFIFGPIGHYKYIFLDYLFMKVKNPRSVYGRLLVDQLFFGPMMTALFYILLAVFHGLDVIKVLKKSLIPTQIQSYTVWPLASLVGFKYIPSDYRILFTTLIGFFWSAVLSIYARQTITELKHP